MRMLFLFGSLLALLPACGPGNGHHEAKDTVSLGPVGNGSGPVLSHDTVSSPAPAPATPEAGLKLSGISAGDTLRSPVLVTGEARGSWYFEGQFVLKLYDSLHRLVALIPARATRDWMTEDFVPFRGELAWKTYSGRGTLVLEADNPSGDEERAKRVSLPVWLKHR